MVTDGIDSELTQPSLWRVEAWDETATRLNNSPVLDSRLDNGPNSWYGSET